MRPDELGKIPMGVEKLFYELQDRIMSDVVRRIKKTGEITSTADYQLNKYELIGNSTEFIEAEIKRLTGMTDAEMWRVYDAVVDKDYTRNKALYEQVNARFIPPEDNVWLKALGHALVSQTAGELNNIPRSMGFSLDYGNGKKVFTPLAEYYQKYIDNACIDIASGAFDYNSVLKRVVKQMTSSGLQYVDYASGYRCRAPVAARRAVLSGVHQLSNKVNEKLANDLGTDDYEVTAHYGARVEHSYWQGGIYSHKELQSVCGLGSAAGLCGANCRHSYLPFVKGISTPSYTSEELEEMRRKDAEIHTFKGKGYNGYEASQKQRSYETTMRAQRARVKLLKDGKADPEEILVAQTKYTQSLREYQQFSKKMGLNTQMERVYIDGLGRIAPGVSSGRMIENKLQKMYNKGNFIENAKAYERDLRGLKNYRKKVPSADLYHYRLNKVLHNNKLIMPKAYVVPAEKRNTYILEDLAYKKDPAHIMKRMLERNITDDQVKEYVDKALFALSHYNDTRLAYYSAEGVTVLTKTKDYETIDWIVKTTWSKHDFDEITNRIIEEAKKV